MPTVIHVLRKFEPLEWGGIETHLLGVIPELARLGWRSEVHAPAEAGTDGSVLQAVGARFRTFRARYPYLGLSGERRARLVAAGGNLVSVSELARLVGDRDAALLHVHTLGRLGGVVRTAARLRGIPYAVSLHGPVRADSAVVEQDARSRTKSLLDLGAPFGWAVGARRVAQDADILFALNRDEFAAWADDRHGRHLERASHGVDPTPATAQARTEARALAGGRPFVLVVGRLDRAKGQDVAMEAFARVAPEGTRLVLAGAAVDAVFAAELRARAASSGPQVKILGGVAPAMARALMAEASLVLVPSRAEPFGIVLLEAWAEGAPALFSCVGGLAGIADECGAGGATVPPGDVEAWTTAIRDALEDRAWSQGERKAGPGRVSDRFTWKKLAEQTAHAYEGARSAMRRTA
jgi:glycosyltransferase involved in cell wall biosynthesis